MKARVNIDFERMGDALRSHVRQKAFRSGSKIVYLKDGQIIEEDIKKHQRQVLPATPSK